MKLKDSLILIVLLLAGWQLLYLTVGDVALRSPAATVQNLNTLLADARFLPHVRETGLAFAQGFAIAVVVGLLIGVPLGAARFAGEVAEPILVALYSIPKVTLYPVILLIFGIGMPAKVAFGAIHGIVPISIFALNAVRNINPTYLRTARVMRISSWELAWKILIPATLPEIVTGIRMGFSLALIGTLLGEMFGSQHGLGHLLMQAMSLHNIERILALTLLIVVFAAGINALLLALDRRLHARA
ncbi:MAG TPA: ABC transporter permease subunit [Burkholderiales bacterium]|nr:ABC transporter permease subunit [Burkholderiales bacterium]